MDRHEIERFAPIMITYRAQFKALEETSCVWIWYIRMNK